MDDGMPPLRLIYSEPAEAELTAAYSWLSSFGFEVAEQWLRGLIRTLEAETELLAELEVRRQPAPDAPEGRDLFLLLY